MTEAEWLACKSWQALLRTLDDRMSARKRRLFVCAFCREMWELLRHPSRTAVEVAERFANGDSFSTERMEAEAAARRAYHTATEQHVGPAHVALFAVQSRLDVHDYKFHVAVHSVQFPSATNPSENCKGADRLADHMRDIFGNPFRPVIFSPSWRTDTAVSLAAQMYEAYEFSAMPILADALQDAGCDSEDILNHCRGDGPHVRGCWVVDMVLGKE